MTNRMTIAVRRNSLADIHRKIADDVKVIATARNTIDML